MTRRVYSMDLLADIVGTAVDPDYSRAAARGPLPPTRRRRRRAVDLTLALLLGLGTAAGVNALRGSAPDPSPRSLLEREIAERSEQANELARTNEEISAEIAGLQAEALAAENPQLFVELRELELASGAIAVSGPGLLLELDDTATDPEDDAARVQDVDLQVVVNGLWSSGAEAIAVNGHRLTALSAIRGAGQAILVGLNPLSPPYRVEAIGDPQDLQVEFAQSTAANHLAFLAGTYGIAVTTRVVDDITLAGAGSTTLRYAVTPEEEGSQ